MKRDRSGDAMTRLALLLASLTFLSAVWIFIQYSTHSIQPARLVVGHRLMAPMTASSLIFISITFIVSPRGRAKRRALKVAARAAAMAACICSGALLLTLLFFNKDLISPLVTSTLFRLPPQVGGQASAATSIGLFFLSCAQMARLLERRRVCSSLALVPLLFSGVALLGYAYGVRELYAFRVLNTMALHSSASLFALAIATLMVQRRRSWLAPLFAASQGGATSRQLFAVVCALPVAGWFLVRATELEILDVAMALAALIIVAVIPLLALALHAGARQDELQAEHDAQARAQTTFTETLERRLADQADALHKESEERAKAEQAMFRSQRLEGIGQLTGGIAHDFNNLLMAITGSHHVLEQVFRSNFSSNHPAHRHLKNASDAAKRGERLTSQLLAFSRKQKIDIKPTDLRQVLEISTAMISSALGPDIDLTWSLHQDEVFILGDATQLELAIINLAMNARDAMPNGGTFSITTSSIPLADASDANPFVSILATDTGTGMSPEVCARAVEPFFTTKPQGKGTGLGLAQVYGFVRQCGGELRISSAQGVGTTVEMTFPMSCRPSKPLPQLARQLRVPPPDEVAKLLLLIDDDSNVRAALGEILRIAGYSVIESGDGEAGLDLLETHKPAAAIIDFLMPGMNGAEVARQARTLMPDLPIIFVSGYYDTASLEKIPDAVVMRKPVEVDTLLDRVATMTVDVA